MTTPGLTADATGDPHSASRAVTRALGRTFRLPSSSVALALLILAVAMGIGVFVGPAELGARAIVLEFVDRIPGVSIDSV